MALNKSDKYAIKIIGKGDELWFYLCTETLDQHSKTENFIFYPNLGMYVNRFEYIRCCDFFVQLTCPSVEQLYKMWPFQNFLNSYLSF